jgi:hypothetical protein
MAGSSGRDPVVAGAEAAMRAEYERLERRQADYEERRDRAAAYAQNLENTLRRYGGTSDEIERLNNLRGQLGQRRIPKEEFPSRDKYTR